MKRYLVFWGNHYYPNRGMNDFKFDSDDLFEIKDRINSSDLKFVNWYQIWDTEKREYVFIGGVKIEN